MLARRGLSRHQSRHVSSVSPLTVLHSYIQKPMGAQFQHHLGHAAGQKHLHGGEITRAVGQRVHQARNLAIDLDPI